MKQWKIEHRSKNPLAIIVARDNKYKLLVQKLARRLALEGCGVETREHVPRRGIVRAHYLICLGSPDEAEEQTLRNSQTNRLIVAAEASGFTPAQKRRIKDLLVVFLPKNFASRLEWSTENILTALFTQPERKEPAQQKKKDEPKTAQETASAKREVRKAISEVTRRAALVAPRSSLVEKRSHIKSLSMWGLFLVFLTVIGFGVIYPYLTMRRVKNNLQASLAALQQADFTKSKSFSLQAEKAADKLRSLYEIGKPVMSSIAPKEARDLETILTAATQTVSTINTLTELGSRGSAFLVKLLNHQPLAIRQETAFFRDRAATLKQRLNRLETTLQTIAKSSSLLARETKKISGVYQNKLPKTLAILEQTQPVIPLLPEMLGAEGRKKYLVLFQNNMELRPTGGFIGSVGFLRFERGKMLELNIEDVYNLDGQLEGHVEPPVPLKKYLGEANWFLRDANWDPDFSRSAEKIRWFLKKEIQSDVDGVIAVDLEFARRLIAVLGGVTIIDSNTHITPDNLYLATQTYSEKEFFPGSSRKRDFLGSLARSILIEIGTKDTTPTVQLVNAVSSSLAEKHILLNFNLDDAQRTFDNLGWTGRLLQPECQIAPAAGPAAGCVADFLMIVDANLGVNKVNYFIERLTNLDIVLTRKRFQRTLTLSYTNQGASDEFPGGTYQNYLRVLVPPNAILESIVVGGDNLDVAQVDREPLGGYQSLGLLLKIPPGSTKTVTVSYATPISLEQPALYELLVQKQPGAVAFPFILNMRTVADTQLEGENFVPIVRTDGAGAGLARGDRLLYNTTLNTDKVFRVKIF